MTQSEAVEIDPEKLSASVKEDLKEELDMNESFAEQKARKVHLDNIDTAEADSTKPSELIKNHFNGLIGNLIGYSRRSPRTGFIKDIKPKGDNMVQLSIDVGDDIVKKVLSEDSKELAHIAEYHSVEKLSNLEDKKIFYYTKHSCEVFIIPQDINSLSNFRYKIYGIQNNLRKRIECMFDKYPDLTFISTVMSIGVSNIILLGNMGFVFNMLALISLSYGLFIVALFIFALVFSCLDDKIQGKNYQI